MECSRSPSTGHRSADRRQSSANRRRLPARCLQPPPQRGAVHNRGKEKEIGILTDGPGLVGARGAGISERQLQWGRSSTKLSPQPDTNGTSSFSVSIMSGCPLSLCYQGGGWHKALVVGCRRGGGVGTCDIWNGEICCRENLAPILKYRCKIWCQIPRLWHKRTPRMLASGCLLPFPRGCAYQEPEK